MHARVAFSPTVPAGRMQADQGLFASACKQSKQTTVCFALGEKRRPRFPHGACHGMDQKKYYIYICVYIYIC